MRMTEVPLAERSKQCLHFAQGAEITYESTIELIGDLEMCMRELYPVEADAMGLFVAALE